MSDRILKKFHGVKTWRSDPRSSLVDIEIKELSDDDDEFQYSVFNLPYHHLRPGATSFCDIRQTGKSLAYKDSFLLYLSLIYATSQNGQDTRGSKCVCFLETVQHNNISIGVRVWFFSNRQKSQLHLNLIKMINLLKKMIQEITSEKSKAAGKVGKFSRSFEV